MSKYDDIINLEYHKSDKHPRMSIESRAAQFSSFAALTGYEDEIKETGRRVDREIELTDDEKENINNLINLINKNDKIKITYFINDNKKVGGKYLTEYKVINRVDSYNHELIFIDKTRIKFEKIIDISFTK